MYGVSAKESSNHSSTFHHSFMSSGSGSFSQPFSPTSKLAARTLRSQFCWKSPLPCPLLQRKLGHRSLHFDSLLGKQTPVARPSQLCGSSEVSVYICHSHPRGLLMMASLGCKKHVIVIVRRRCHSKSNQTQAN